jgi:RNA polymerase sigma-70 factor, ECF subfamily
VPWEFAIARRLCIDRQRRARLEERHASAEPGPGEIPAPVSNGADDWLHARELAERLEEGLAALPASQREAFSLLRQEGLTHVQAAEALGTTASAVKLRTHRAYEKLRAALGAPLKEETT